MVFLMTFVAGIGVGFVIILLALAVLAWEFDRMNVYADHSPYRSTKR